MLSGITEDGLKDWNCSLFYFFYFFKKIFIYLFILVQEWVSNQTRADAKTLPKLMWILKVHRLTGRLKKFMEEKAIVG